MDFRLLGELEIEGAAGLLPLRPRKQRSLLTLLLLHAGEVLSRDFLIDQLWERPPEDPAHALDVQISRLRAALRGLGGGAAELLVSRAGGYVLLVDRAQIDVARVERFVGEAREALARGDPAGAAKLLRAALMQWRGEPLADLTFEPFAQLEIARLTELRLDAVEELAEARLALGDHADLVGELEPLVDRHPLRERLRGQLMLALYRCGRQAEALNVYQQGRRVLVEQLGIEPDEPMQRLQQAILLHDPALAGSPIAEPALDSPLTPQTTARTRRVERRPHHERSPLRTILHRRRRAPRAIEAAGWEVYASSRIAPDELRSELATLGGAVAVAARAAEDADSLLAETDQAQLARRLRRLREGPVSERTVVAATPVARELAAVEALQERRRRFEQESDELATRLKELVEAIFRARFEQTVPALLIVEARELLEIVHALTSNLQDACARLRYEIR